MREEALPTVHRSGIGVFIGGISFLRDIRLRRANNIRTLSEFPVLG
jgi:hypothetical protein